MQVRLSTGVYTVSVCSTGGSVKAPMVAFKVSVILLMTCCCVYSSRFHSFLDTGVSSV